MTSPRFIAGLFFAIFAVHAQIAFSPLEKLTNSEARLRLAVPAGTFARIDASTNLFDWNGYLTAGGGSLVHTDVFARFSPTRSIAPRK